MTRQIGSSDDVIAFVRGEAGADTLESLGIEILISDQGLRLREAPGVPVVVPTREDVANGLLTNYAKVTTFKEWAKAILAANFIDLVELETQDNDPLVEALWAIAAGEEPPAAALEAARALVER